VRAAVAVEGRVELTAVPEPEVGPGDVLIEVHASSVNRADLAVRTGTHVPAGASSPPLPSPVAVGLDAAGVVAAVGAGVDSVAVGVGDRVMAMASGGLAERAVVPAGMIVPIPAGWSFAEGAAAIVGLMTEHDALRTAGRLGAGERVLVLGAGSGVGLQGVQLARRLGAGSIIAVARSDRASATLRDLGADSVVVVGHDLPARFSGEVLDAVDGDGVDVVLDHVGGPYLAETMRCMGVGGRIVGIGRLGGAVGELDMELMAFRRVELIGVTFRTRSVQDKVDIVRRLRDELGDGLADLRPPIDRVLPWTDVDAAHALLTNNQSVGKVVLEVRH